MMMLGRWVMILLFVMGLATTGLAQEPKKVVAPDELPTHLIKVLRTTNKAQTNRYVPRVYTTKSNPFTMYRWINRSTRIEEGAYHFFAERTADGKVGGGKIVVVAPEYMLPGIDAMMKIIDRPGLTSSAGEFFYYFRPKHRSVTDAGFINQVKALSINDGTGSKVVDAEANMYLVYDRPSGTNDLKAFMPLIDVAPPQVIIEATIYEVYVDNESKIGLDYVAWKNGPGRNLAAFGAYYEKGSGGSLGVPGHGFRTSGSNAAWFLDVPSAFFDFLVVKGKARVMTSAKIAARNLITATLTSSDTILYYKTQVGPAVNGGIRPTGTGALAGGLDPDDDPEDNDGKTDLYPDNRTVVSTYVTRELAGASHGVKLVVTPTIAENEIDLEIETEVVSHTGFDDKGVPVLARRKAVTQVRVRDGQESILGGYSREIFIQRSDKIPILGSLPIIGYLFGGDANTTERRRVVMVLTPHVVKDFSAMNYKQTKIDAAAICSKALRKKATAVPKTEAGFDQWLMDDEQ
jgi:type II secretory pathway component GspD/PulD (secretin)